jgi:cellulose synthase/poly-beta-1,6-N-acetylglucosamine synthase-like glycosyltransferase
MSGAFVDVKPAHPNANESGSASAARDAMSPLVSIVTPSFNSAAYIERTIQSIHGQGYPRIEHVVMDGGSTDGTQEIIAKHREKFAHVESGPDSGMYDSIAAFATRLAKS